MLGTFSMVTLAWVFFRADSIAHASGYLANMFSTLPFSAIEFSDKSGAVNTLALILIFTLAEWAGRNNKYAIEKTFINNHIIVRYSLYYALVLVILTCGKFGNNQFIYFQF